MSEKISEVIVNRAVELWCRKLNMPKFDNGDDSTTGIMSMMLATLNIHNDKDEISDMLKRIEVFRKELTEAINKSYNDSGYYNSYLSVDYGPDKILHDAAVIAEIPSSQFSCKSTVSFSSDCVTTSFGYGAEGVNHFPLPDGRWLITTLRGSDINKIITQVMNGNDLGFEIEKVTP